MELTTSTTNHSTLIFPVADLHEILSSRTPVGSQIDKITEIEGFQKDLLSAIHESGIESISLEDSEVELEFMRARIIKKVAPMINPGCDSEFPWIGKFAKISKRYRTDINDVLQLIPHRGLLKPSEIQYVHVVFQPKPNINIRAMLECEVLGGPAESIIVTGQSSDLMYKINTQQLNFKIRSFHESATEQLLISNIAQLPYEYKTYLDEPKFENELEGTILDLIPPEKILEPEEEAELKVVMRPGVVGYFRRNFLLEIGHLPHIPIEVFGWGVIPQVYLTLPRPEIADVRILKIILS